MAKDVRVPLTEDQRAKLQGTAGRQGERGEDLGSTPEQKDLRAQDTMAQMDLRAQDTSLEASDTSLEASDTSIESDDMSTDSDF